MILKNGDIYTKKKGSPDIYQNIEIWADLLEEKMREQRSKTAEEVIFENALQTGKEALSELTTKQQCSAASLLCSIWYWGEILKRWRNDPKEELEKPNKEEIEWAMSHMDILGGSNG